MKIAAISDTHCRHEEIEVPVDADVVVHAGDISGRGRHSEIESFLQWYGGLENQHKVLVAGNHDWGFEQNPEEYAKMAAKYGVILLNDSGCTIDGIKFWGSPVQPAFCNWAFNRSREDVNTTRHCAGHAPIRPHWELIPIGTDVVITHGPAHRRLDKTYYGSDNVGCEILAEKLLEIKPLLHVSGHIHEARGVLTEYHASGSYTTFCNASSLDLQYEPWNDETFVFDLDNLRAGVSDGRD